MGIWEERRIGTDAGKALKRLVAPWKGWGRFFYGYLQFIARRRARYER